jgi:hypothetical protein
MPIITIKVDGSQASVVVNTSSVSQKKRVFNSESPMNIPIPANPVIDVNSAVMVSALSARGSTAMLHEYGGTIYESVASDPIVKIICKNHWFGYFEGEFRIPHGAKPVGGSDGSMIVLDTTTGLGIDFWQVSETSPGIYTTSYCSRWPYGGNGVPGYGACGWGEPLIAGMPRVWEMKQGRIEHALAFASSLSGNTYRYPASKSDGGNTYPPGIPEGTRLQLDPTADLSKCNPAEKIIAEAAQVYGLYCNNTTAPGIGIGFEDAGPVVTGNPYYSLGMTHDSWSMSNIPWSKLRVLRTWNGL